jgi:hypothetical protein
MKEKSQRTKCFPFRNYVKKGKYTKEYFRVRCICKQLAESWFKKLHSEDFHYISSKEIKKDSINVKNINNQINFDKTKAALEVSSLYHVKAFQKKLTQLEILYYIYNIYAYYIYIYIIYIYEET